MQTRNLDLIGKEAYDSGRGMPCSEFRIQALADNLTVALAESVDVQYPGF